MKLRLWMAHFNSDVSASIFSQHLSKTRHVQSHGNAIVETHDGNESWYENRLRRPGAAQPRESIIPIATREHFEWEGRNAIDAKKHLVTFQ